MRTRSRAFAVVAALALAVSTLTAGGCSAARPWAEANPTAAGELVETIRAEARESGRRTAEAVTSIGATLAAQLSSAIPAIGGAVGAAVEALKPAAVAAAGNAGESAGGRLADWLLGLLGLTTAGGVVAAVKGASSQGRHDGWDEAVAARAAPKGAPPA